MHIVNRQAMPLIVKARQRVGTSSMDLTVPVSIAKQYDIKPGDIFVISCNKEGNEKLELIYRKVFINQKR